MIKTKERSETQSCWNKAHEHELIFILLARDPAAPVAIEAWAAERIRSGKNQAGDVQIAEALACALRMRSAENTHASQR